MRILNSARFSSSSEVGKEKENLRESAVLVPNWGAHFFDRAAFCLWNYGMYCQENVIGAVEECNRMRREAIKLLGQHGMNRISRGHRYVDLSSVKFEEAPQLVAFCRSITDQFAENLNQRMPDIGLSRKVCSMILLESSGSGPGISDHVDWDSELVADPRKLTVTYFLNPNWNSSVGGNLVYTNLPKEATVLPDTVSPEMDTVVLHWSDTTSYAVKPFKCQPNQSLICIKVFLLTQNISVIGEPVSEHLPPAPLPKKLAKPSARKS